VNEVERDLKSIQTLKLLKLLSDTAPRRWTAGELSHRLDIHPRSLYRYLAELSRHVYLRRDGQSWAA